MLYSEILKRNQLENVAIIVLPLKAARRDSIWGFKSELQTNQMPFYLESPWVATLMPDRGPAMDWDKTK